MRITCRVHPGASRERVEWADGAAAVWVTAPAVEGRANRALLRALARELRVAPGRVRLVAGERSRSKVVEVEGLEVLPARRPPLSR